MGFFSDAFKGPAFAYATNFNMLCEKLGIDTGRVYFFSQDDMLTTASVLNSGRSGIPMHLINTFVSCFQDDNYSKFGNAKEVGLQIYLYSLLIYGDSDIPDHKVIKDKQIFEEVYGY